MPAATTYRLHLPLGEAFRASTGRQMQIAGRNFTKIVEAYQDDIKNRAGLKRVNQALANSMQEAVLAAYRDRVLAHAVPSYRKGQKRFPGGLLEALEDPTMAVGTAEGIHFINEDLLNAKAVFWRRLNFGTEGTGGQRFDFPASKARLQFGANQGFSLALPEGRRPAFRIPEFPKNGTNIGLGYFNPAGQFFTGYRKGQRDVSQVVRGDYTRGIGARHFLEEGLVAFVRDFKPFYKEYTDDLTRRVESRIKSKG